MIMRVISPSFRTKRKRQMTPIPPQIFMMPYWIMFEASIRWKGKRYSDRSTPAETTNMRNTRRMAW